MKTLDFLFNQDTLIAGVDSGNISNKVTYINEKGDIDSINVPSIIGINADTTAADLGEMEGESKSFPDEYILHVNINSPALPKNRTNAYYTVGEYAQITAQSQDLLETSGEAKDKLGAEIHVVTTLTALALAAWKANKSDKINIPLSFGLPIEEARRTAKDKLDIFMGEHTVSAVDGPYKGKTITLNITDVKANVEGVTSYLGLIYDLVEGQIVKTKFRSQLHKEFAVSDLGAGTFDIGLFDENGLNSRKSTNYSIGTNVYIDRIMQEIINMPEFEKIVARAKRSNITPKITFSREEFMRKFIKPVIHKSIQDSEYTPIYEVTWQSKTADATEIIEKHMKAYADEIQAKIDAYFTSTNIGQMIIVGGGLLFGYKFLKHLEEEDCLFPPNLIESSFFTSKAYLLKNITSEIAKQNALAK